MVDATAPLRRRKTDVVEITPQYAIAPYLVTLLLGMMAGLVAYQLTGPSIHNAIIGFFY